MSANYLSITVSTSLFENKTLISDQLATMMNSYSHVISALGGYISAEFNLSVNQAEANEWMEKGLMRHIEVAGPTPCWEGFVNEIEFSYGDTLTVRRGPVMGVSNQVRVMYQTVSYNTNPPIPSSPAGTAYANHLGSQDKYGIFQTILSMGESSAVLAEQGRDSFLAEYAWPKTSPDNISLPASGGGVSVTIRCLGYNSLFERYVYNQTIVGSTINASAKLALVLAADPNGIMDDNQTISANTLQVPAHENNNNPASTVIKAITGLGDVSDNRWLFGVYDRREVIYKIAPTTIGYQFRMSENQALLEDGSGNGVTPWNVKPGSWLLITDMIQTKSLPDTPSQQEPRLVFIESVTYSAPYTIRIMGTKVNKAIQFLARVGLEGI